MLFPAAILGTLLLAQTPAAPHAAHRATRHQAASAEKTVSTPAQPKTAAELEKELQAGFTAAPFLGDKVECRIVDGNLTLEGTVHNAEHKGQATRLARELAEKSGWGKAHVYNRLAVELPPLPHR
ncbi:MAG: BON domain-containing protein [Terriglobales bacterium]